MNENVYVNENVHVNLGEYMRNSGTYLRNSGTYMRNSGTYLRNSGTYLRNSGTYLRNSGTYMRNLIERVHFHNTWNLRNLSRYPHAERECRVSLERIVTGCKNLR